MSHGFRFTPEQIKNIDKYWYTGCPERKSVSICDKHQLRHRRTPDKETFAYLILLYPDAPLQAWGDVFGVTRESIRLLYLQISKSGSWEIDRKSRRYGERPNWTKFNEFFKQYEKDTTNSKLNILEGLDINLHELEYWDKFNVTFHKKYEESKKARKHAISFPSSITCYRCGIAKELDAFGYSKAHTNKKSRTCKECAYAAVSAYNMKRQEEFDIEKVDKSKTCSICLKLKDRSEFYFNKANRGGLQNRCKRCQSTLQKLRS
jgi:hypothetical protein